MSSSQEIDPSVVYTHWVDPNYKYVEEVDIKTLRAEFQLFTKEQIAKLPVGVPADAHLFNTFMTDFNKKMVEAYNSFLRASLAYYAERDSCPDTT